MPLSDKEKMQIREVVDQVMEARLLEFSEIQLTLIKNMLLAMTDKYVESLMKLCRVIGIPDQSALQETNRMTEMMMEELRK